MNGEELLAAAYVAALAGGHSCDTAKQMARRAVRDIKDLRDEARVRK